MYKISTVQKENLGKENVVLMEENASREIFLSKQQRELKVLKSTLEFSLIEVLTISQFFLVRFTSS